MDRHPLPVPLGNRTPIVEMDRDHAYQLMGNPDAPYAAMTWHRRHDGSWCGGLIFFAPRQDRPTWVLEQADPLTCSPSVWCRSASHPDDGMSHGWIRDGRWEPAGALPDWSLA